MEPDLRATVRPILILSALFGFTFTCQRKYLHFYRLFVLVFLISAVIVHIPIIYFWVNGNENGLDSFLQLAKISVAWLSYFTNFLVTAYYITVISKLLHRTFSLELKVSKSYQRKMFWSQFIHVFVNFIWISACQAVAVYLTPEHVKRPYSLAMYIIVESMSTLVLLQFVQAVLLVKVCFLCLNQRIKHLREKLLKIATTKHSSAHDEVIKIRLLSSEICDIGRGWCNCYQFQLVLSLTKCFIEVTFSLTSLLELGHGKNYDLGVFLAFAGACFNLLIIIQICWSCQMARQEFVKVETQIISVSNATMDLEVKEEVRMFCIQNLHHTLQFSVLGFFSLDSKLLQEIFASIMSYLAIIYTFSHARNE